MEGLNGIEMVALVWCVIRPGSISEVGGGHYGALWHLLVVNVCECGFLIYG